MIDIKKVISWIEDELQYKSDIERSQNINTLLRDADLTGLEDNQVITANIGYIKEQLLNPPNMVMDYEIKRYLDNIKFQLDSLGK